MSAAGAAGALLALAVTAAGGCGAAGDLGSDDGPPDGPSLTCSVTVVLDRALPESGPGSTVRADAEVLGAAGVPSFAWSVSFGGRGGSGGAPVPFVDARPDGSAIAFPVAAAGVYTVRVDVRSAGDCPGARSSFTARAPNAASELRWLRAMAPASDGAPPFEERRRVYGGGDEWLGDVAIAAGAAEPIRVVDGDGDGVAAYVRFAPAGAPRAFVEAFSSASGAVDARLASGAYDVTVIPLDPRLAPRLVEGWTPLDGSLQVGPGTAVTGTVRGPTGALLPGAVVQLEIGGVPSTLATTGPDGAFALRASLRAGAEVALAVAPPAGSGLPRLTAPLESLPAPAPPLAIRYVGVTLRDAGGMVVRRGGAPLAGRRVVLVGGMAKAGEVVVGSGAPVDAEGAVRIATQTGAGGALPPPTRAPALALSAVVEVAAADLAIAPLDLSASVPSSIDAPPPVTAAPRLRDPGGALLEGALLDAHPVGTLALAGFTSPVRARSGAGGVASLSLAAGGVYDLRVHDPVQRRGALRVVAGVPAAGLAASYSLRRGVALLGRAVEPGGPTPIEGAVMQLLCDERTDLGCRGVERSRPVAETTTAADGSFSLVVPDPEAP